MLGKFFRSNALPTVPVVAAYECTIRHGPISYAYTPNKYVMYICIFIPLFSSGPCFGSPWTNQNQLQPSMAKCSAMRWHDFSRRTDDEQDALANCIVRLEPQLTGQLRRKNKTTGGGKTTTEKKTINALFREERDNRSIAGLNFTVIGTITRAHHFDTNRASWLVDSLVLRPRTKSFCL
jgi:hypothetical protein